MRIIGIFNVFNVPVDFSFESESRLARKQTKIQFGASKTKNLGPRQRSSRKNGAFKKVRSIVWWNRLPTRSSLTSWHLSPQRRTSRRTSRHKMTKNSTSFPPVSFWWRSLKIDAMRKLIRHSCYCSEQVGHYLVTNFRLYKDPLAILITEY